MAKREHLNLIRQGIAVWNEWREKHPDIQPDLSRANLRNILGSISILEADPKRISVIHINLSHANLREANFGHATLLNADFSYSDLEDAYFGDANLSTANFSDANLSNAAFMQSISISTNFSNADLRHVAFNNALLYMANLSHTNLTSADFVQAHLMYCNLDGADFNDASVGLTTFGNANLNGVKGLETVRHHGPSVIGTNTMLLPRDNIPEVFLRRAGVFEETITYTRSSNYKPIEYYTCFISYSSKDEDFVQHLHADLQNYGVLCWYAPKDMKIGDKIRPKVYESIKQYNKLLLVLSQQSLESNWVEYEVEAALAKERREHRTVLFPVRLDTAAMESTTAWAAHIQDTRNIGNFENWKDSTQYQKALTKLLTDLIKNA